MPHKYLKKGEGKQAYMAKQMRIKKEVKQTTKKDMAQDYRLKTVEKKVKSLTAATSGWKVFQTNEYAEVPSMMQQSTASSIPLLMDPTYIITNTEADNKATAGFREGDFISVRRIKGRYLVKAPSAAAGENQLPYRCRVMVICSKKPNGEPSNQNGSLGPTYNDLFAYVNEGVTNQTLPDILARYNPSNRGNFHVYYDKIHTILPLNTQLASTDNVSVANDRVVAEGKFNIVPNKVNATVTYNNSKVEAPDEQQPFVSVSKNQWYIIALSDNENVSVSPPTQTNPCSICMNVLTEFTA